MYSAPYGYPNAAGPTFNGAPPGQSPHMQPGPGPNQPQQMMYNPQQQFPMGAQGPYPGGPNPGAMMPGAGPAGMMQNPGMPMGPNGQMAYQTPYTSGPYGAGVPTTAPQGQFPPNYMMAAGQMGGFPMNAGGMNPQQQQQQQQQQMMMRNMHPSQQNPAAMGASTPQRQFSGPQGTPNSAMSQQQSQFPTPQNQQGTPQSQTPTQAQQTPNNVTTPQTPTFPSTGQAAGVNGASASTPLSPGTESKEKERFTLLLDINQELLFELIQLKNTQDELKKEHAAASSSNTPEQQKEALDEEKAVHADWVQCIRRLQANLSYLASLADRKASAQVPPCPGYLSAPPLNMKVKLKALAVTPDATERSDSSGDREDRDKYIKELYKRLQGLFPGFDPKKEPPYPTPAQQKPNAAQAAAMQNAQQQRMASGQAPNSGSPAQVQKTPQMTTAPAPSPAQATVSS